MPSSLWLITEDQSDFEIVKQIFMKRNIDVTLRFFGLESGSGGISQLAEQLPKLIKGVRANKKMKRGDCIVVLHDLDAESQQLHNKAYKDIGKICSKEGVMRIIADDEIEAWLLADKGLCSWLNIKAKSWDGKPRVKEALVQRLHKKYPNMRYGGPDRDKIIANLDGSGLERSISMKAAFDQLKEANCL